MIIGLFFADLKPFNGPAAVFSSDFRLRYLELHEVNLSERYKMRRDTAICLLLLLSGCGLDVASSAATGAATKAEEIKQAEKTKEQVLQRIDAANQAAEQQRQEMEKAANP